VIKQHCETVGRDYGSIHRTSSSACIMGESDEEALAQLKPRERQMVDMLRRTSMIGTPEEVRRRLGEYEEAGVQELILTFPNIINLEPMRAFAHEFIQK
jgi:alkanesulfonate monooxygenase SsuD/methylene tetrahydromethanopterin reductase-like flavin-dependent oxidoreductase (luciferase family)